MGNKESASGPSVRAAGCGTGAIEEQRWIGSALRETVAAPLLRVWTYPKPAVVLGCAQRARSELAARAAALQMELCVRPTGGGAVLAGPWLIGSSVVLPPRHPYIVESIPQSFRWFGLAHAAWLQDAGIEARAVPTAQTRNEESLSWACFASLSHWEVEAGGGKIVGLSQARRRSGVLFSSAVLVGPCPWGVLCEVLGQPRQHAAMLARITSSCAQLLGGPMAPETLSQSLLQALSGALTGSA
ncbi:MAG TPA: ligase [Burkholderiales bacterium]|nr:ligase [Burkholderiales bacterium]